MNEQRKHVEDTLLSFYIILQNTTITVKTQTTCYLIISLTENRKNVLDFFTRFIIIYVASDKCIFYLLQAINFALMDSMTMKVKDNKRLDRHRLYNKKEQEKNRCFLIFKSFSG